MAPPSTKAGEGSDATADSKVLQINTSAGPIASFSSGCILTIDYEEFGTNFVTFGN